MARTRTGRIPNKRNWSPVDPPDEPEEEYEPLPPLPPYSAKKENPGD